MPALEQFEHTQVHDIPSAVAGDGACVGLTVLSAPHCDALVADFQKHLDGMAWGVDDPGYRSDFYGGQTNRLHGLFSKSARMVDVLTHPAAGAAKGKAGGREILISANCALKDFTATNGATRLVPGGFTVSA